MVVEINNGRICARWCVSMYVVIKGKKLIGAALCLIIVAAAVISWIGFSNRDDGIVEAAASNDNWGLSFQEEGKTPVGNATPEFLKQYNAYFCGNSEDKKIYLTFDCGYENGYTPAILEALEKHNVKAAFFVVGNYLETSPDLVKRMVEEGHIVGNHTYHHPDMSQISDPASFQKEITSLEKKYQEITGLEMQKFYRPPQGKYSESNLKMAQELGYQTVFWSLAYVDWYVDQQPTQ